MMISMREIEETLIMGDLGIQTTMAIVEDLRKKVKKTTSGIRQSARIFLIASIKEQMDLGENAYEFENRKSGCAGDRRQRRREDDLGRKAGGPVKGSGQEGHSGGGGYIPCGSD
ncbi:MAG: signal recognition particle receptor subunit alpha [Clostridium fessum]